MKKSYLVNLISTFGRGIKTGTETNNFSIKLRGLIAILLLLPVFTLSLYGQTFLSNRYYQVILKVDGTETKLSQHITQLTAETKLNCRDGYVIPPTGKTLTAPQFKCPIVIVTDTIEKDVHLYGGVFSPTTAVFDDCEEKYIITKKIDQVVPDGTFKATLKRTKNYKDAVTTYEVLKMTEIPMPAFRVIRNDVSEITANQARINISITKKQSNIKGFLNGVQVKEFNPGSSETDPDGNFYFYFGYDNLMPNTNYEVFVRCTSLEGEITESPSILFKTL